MNEGSEPRYIYIRSPYASVTKYYTKCKHSQSSIPFPLTPFILKLRSGVNCFTETSQLKLFRVCYECYDRSSTSRSRSSSRGVATVAFATCYETGALDGISNSAKLEATKVPNNNVTQFQLELLKLLYVKYVKLSIFE